MAALTLPVHVLYAWPPVFLSMGAAVVASAVALFVVRRKTMGIVPAAFGSLFMGSGISAMHYIGMEAMRLPDMCSYDMRIVALSIALAVVISFVSLVITFPVRSQSTSFSLRKTLSALVMGLPMPLM